MDAILIMTIILAGIFATIFFLCFCVIYQRRNAFCSYMKQGVSIKPNDISFKKENDYEMVKSRKTINHNINGSTRLYLNMLKTEEDVAEYRKRIEGLEL